MHWLPASLAGLAIAAPLAAQGWQEPARGTALRADLMDALRPHAEWVLGAPVVFRVSQLRVSGDVAFGAMTAIRPDGREITADQIPVRPGGYNPFEWDGPSLQVLYKRSGNTWVAVHHAMGATDVWWADPEFCPDWAAVIPEICR